MLSRISYFKQDQILTHQSVVRTVDGYLPEKNKKTFRLVTLLTGLEAPRDRSCDRRLSESND